MYKKAAALLVSVNLIFLIASLCSEGMESILRITCSADPLNLRLDDIDKNAAQALQAPKYSLPADNVIFMDQGMGIMDIAVSGQRVLDCGVIEHKAAYKLSADEEEVLMRIVEAEAGSEDEDGRLLVANVVLNRMNSRLFPDTVTEVVFQKYKGRAQFSPVSSGRYYSVEISDRTRSAVERAIEGEDISQGALYFASRKRASESKMKWFDTKLTFLFEHGGHEFFK